MILHPNLETTVLDDSTNVRALSRRQAGRGYWEYSVVLPNHDFAELLVMLSPTGGDQCYYIGIETEVIDVLVACLNEVKQTLYKQGNYSKYDYATRPSKRIKGYPWEVKTWLLNDSQDSKQWLYAFCQSLCYENRLILAYKAREEEIDYYHTCSYSEY